MSRKRLIPSLFLAFALFGIASSQVLGLSIEESASQKLSISAQDTKGLPQGNMPKSEPPSKPSLPDFDAVTPLLSFAEAALRKGQLDEVEQHLRRILELNPQSGVGYTAWGRYLYLQGKFTDAEAAFQKAISLEPRLVDPLVELGALYMLRLGKPDKAAEAYRAALSIRPDVVEFRYGLAMALAMAGKASEAATTLREVADSTPDDPYPWQLLGTLYFQNNDYAQALDAFANALEAQPDLVQARWARGEIYFVTDRQEKALKEYSLALEADSQFAPALVRIGIIHQQNQRIAEAEQAYLKAIAISPELAIVYNNLAFGAAERGERLDDALMWARKAVELASENPDFQDTLGWVYRARGELQEAALALEEAAAKGAQNADIFYHLGIVYAELGKSDRARMMLERSLQLNENSANAQDARRLLAALD